MSGGEANLTEAVVGDNGVLTLYVKGDDGQQIDLKLGPRAQGMLLQVLLGSTLDPLSVRARRFEPGGLSRFRIGDDVGLSFLLSREIALHFVLDRSVAAILKDLLVTFDDPSTWHIADRFH